MKDPGRLALLILAFSVFFVRGDGGPSPISAVSSRITSDWQTDLCNWLTSFSGASWAVIDASKPSFCDTTPALSKKIIDSPPANATQLGLSKGKWARWATLEILFLPKYAVTGSDGVTKEYMCRTPQILGFMDSTIDNIALIDGQRSDNQLSSLICNECINARSLANSATAPSANILVVNDLDVDVAIIALRETGAILATDLIKPELEGVSVLSKIGTAYRFEDPKGNCLGITMVTEPSTIRLSRLGCVLGEQASVAQEICSRCTSNDLRSNNSDIESTIDFVNYLSESVKVYWIGYDGAEHEYISEIKAGQLVRQNSFVTHPWRVRKMTGQCISVFMTPRGLSTARIGTCSSSPNPQQLFTSGGLAASAPTICGMCDQSLTSKPSMKSSHIKFTNRLSINVKIFWINFEGAMVSYVSSLAPGQVSTWDSYSSHVWKVTSQTNECLGVYVVQDTDTAVDIGSCVLGTGTVLSGLSSYIAGEVWEDLDLDGLDDLDEPKLSGVTVRLRPQRGDGTIGPVLATTVTDAQGQYRFNGVDPMIRNWIEFQKFDNRDFTIQVMVQGKNESDAQVTTGVSGSVIIPAGMPGERVNAGVRPLATPTPTPPLQPPVPDSCIQTGCKKFIGNYDYAVIGNTMSYSESSLNCGMSYSSEAYLTVPSGATVYKAFLYWSGSGQLNSGAEWLRMSGSQLSSRVVYADSGYSWGSTLSSGYSWYSAMADVTAYVSGSGYYTVADMWTQELYYGSSSYTCRSSSSYAAWSLVVIYQKSTLPRSRINFCYTPFQFTYPAGSYSWSVQCVGPPIANRYVRTTVVGFEGDSFVGEDFYIQGQHQGYNLFRGSGGPNFDIINKDISTLSFQSTQVDYQISTYAIQTQYGLAVDGIFMPVKVVYYRT